MFADVRGPKSIQGHVERIGAYVLGRIYSEVADEAILHAHRWILARILPWILPRIQQWFFALEDHLVFLDARCWFWFWDHGWARNNRNVVFVKSVGDENPSATLQFRQYRAGERSGFCDDLHQVLRETQVSHGSGVECLVLYDDEYEAFLNQEMLDILAHFLRRENQATTSLRYLMIYGVDTSRTRGLDYDVLYQALEETTILKGICLPVPTSTKCRQLCSRLPGIKSLSSLCITISPATMHVGYQEEIVDAIRRNTNLFQFQCSTGFKRHMFEEDLQNKIDWYLRRNKLDTTDLPVPKSYWPTVLVHRYSVFHDKRLSISKRFHLLRNVFCLADHVTKITPWEEIKVKTAPQPRNWGFVGSGLFSLVSLTSLVVSFDKRRI